MKCMKGIRGVSSRLGHYRVKHMHLAGDLRLMQLSIILIILTKEAITGASIELENILLQIDNFPIRVLGCSSVVSGMRKTTQCRV